MQGRISGSLQKFFMMQIRFPVRVIRVRLRRTVTGAEKRRIRKSSGRKRGNKMKIGNKEFDTAKHTYIMGILNVTPDSFSDGGKVERL